jgi:hypothetical protein
MAKFKAAAAKAKEAAIKKAAAANEVSVGGKGPTYWADAAYQVNPANTGMTR